MTLALYPYQETGVRFLRVAESALLADEMGTGKTAQTIATLEADDLYPALIVCPNTVKFVWRREFAKWAPDREVVVASNGTVAANKDAQAVLDGEADVLVINWEATKNLSRLAGYGSIHLAGCTDCDPNSTRRPAQCERENKVLNTIPWKVVIADEVHRAKSPKAKQTRALWAVGDDADRRYALTGSPLTNSPADLWSVMRFVSPTEYPAKWPWLERYAKLQYNPFSQSPDVVGLREDRRDELDRFLMPRFLRRTKAMVLPDLPPKTYERRDVVLTGKQKKAYDSLRDDCIAAIDGGMMSTTSILTQALRLRQFAAAYGELIVDPKDATQEMTFDDIGTEFDKLDAHVRLSEPSSKLDALEDVLLELGDQPVVVFADSRQLIDLAFARFVDKVPCAKITGPIATKEREVAVENFQDGLVRIMFATVGAGGEGITLTAASTAVFLQRPWSLVQSKQAEDRLHRIGQDAENVLYIDLVTADTVEERVFEALMEKGEMLEDLVRDKENLQRWLK